MGIRRLVVDRPYHVVLHFLTAIFFSVLSHGIESMRGSNEAIRGEDGVVDRRAHELNLHVLQFLALLRKDYLIR